MFKKSAIILATIFGLTTTAFSQTTMCFKQNHESLVTIENTNLDGGECKGEKSPKDMREEGWTINDIKMIPNKDGGNTDFIYIFKKEASNVAQNEEELMNKLQAKLKEEKTQEENIKKEQILLKNSNAGKTLYLRTCAVCHGEKGELKARGVSKPIRSLDHKEFEVAIRDYVIGEKQGVMAQLMSQYANLLNSNDIRNIYTYLKFVNQDKKEE